MESTLPLTPTTKIKSFFEQVFKKRREPIESSLLFINEVLEKKVKKAENEINLTEAYYLSTKWHIGKYATLNLSVREELIDLIDQITKYYRDSSDKKPYNVLIKAPPGLGKSFLLECLVEALSGNSKSNNAGSGKKQDGSPEYKAVTFNMSGMETLKQMSKTLAEVRNIKIEGNYPILFLDEFDSHDYNYPLLLPLLLDGIVQLEEKKINIGKTVIMLAGSSPELINITDRSKKLKTEKYLAPYQNTKLQSSNRLFSHYLATNILKEFELPKKLPDLLSRINGQVITLTNSPQNGALQKADRICVAINIIKKQKFNNEEKSIKIPWRFLKFIADSPLTYGVRSIENFIKKTEPQDDNSLSLAKLDKAFVDENNLVKTGLIYQIENARDAIKKWEELRDCPNNELMLLINVEKKYNAEEIEKIFENLLEEISLGIGFSTIEQEFKEKFLEQKYAAYFKDKDDFYEVLYQTLMEEKRLKKGC